MPIAVSTQAVVRGAVRIRTGWDQAGKEGTALGGPFTDSHGQSWVVVEWPDSEDPDLFKTQALEISTAQWKPL